MSVAKGCTCDSGYNGQISTSTSWPYFSGRCKQVECPQHSTGEGVPAGCTCDDGFVGTIQPSNVAPYFTGWCSCNTKQTVADGARISTGSSWCKQFVSTSSTIDHSAGYDNQENCTWRISCPHGLHTIVEFNSFDTEPSRDNVSLLDESSQLVLFHKSGTLAQTNGKFSAPSTLHMRFATDACIVNAGFSVRFSCNAAPVTCSFDSDFCGWKHDRLWRRDRRRPGNDSADYVASFGIESRSTQQRRRTMDTSLHARSDTLQRRFLQVLNLYGFESSCSHNCFTCTNGNKIYQSWKDDGHDDCG